MPPRKAAEDGQVDIHASYVPLTTPISFVSSSVICYVVGNNVCLWDIKYGNRDYLYTSAYSITKICGNAARGLVAFCEGGTSPQVFVYCIEPRRLMYTLSDVTELELADMAFSRCGSRLYTLSRATAKRLCVFSTLTGERLQGCETELPLRFDKVSVYPGHKDRLALVRSSSVRIVTLQKSYETYIARLHPSAIPSDVDLSVSAYTWMVSGHFLFATRQGLLCALDGSTGAVLHACQAEQPITSITVMRGNGRIITAHIGNILKVWRFDAQQLNYDCNVRLTNAPSMEYDAEVVQVYSLLQKIDFEKICQEMRSEHALAGQVAYLQCLPDFSDIVLTTAEGEVWTFSMPGHDDPAAELVMDAKLEDLDLRLLTWFHTHPISDVKFLGPGLRICASGDEGGRLRIWEIETTEDPKGFRTLRFASAITSIAADDEGKVLVVGTDTGVTHIVDCSNWKKAAVVDSLRISEAGIVKLVGLSCEGRFMYVGASLFNNKVAFLSIMLRDQKLRMYGFVDGLGPVEDLCFHIKDFKPESAQPPKLLVVSSYQHPGMEAPWPCLWAVLAPPLDFEPASMDLRRDTCPVWSMKLGTDPRNDDKPTTVASASKKSVIVGFASGAMKIYPIPSNSGNPMSKQAPGQPHDALSPHGQLVTTVHVSQDGFWLVSGSMDGSIKRCPLEGSEQLPEAKMIHNPYNGGTIQASMYKDNAAMLSTGGSDGVLVWSLIGADIQMAAVLDEEPEDDEAADINLNAEINDKDMTAYPVWSPQAEDHTHAAVAEADDPELNAVAVAQRKALVLEVQGLQKKLRILADANNHCPELEKLERHEFCVDHEERDAIAAKTKSRCDALRAQIEKENLVRQLIRDRLIKEFWDPMRTKGCQINSLMSNFSVSNYPERIVSDEESGTTKKLRCMREVELMELQMLRDDKCHEKLREDVILKAEQFTTGSEAYIVNWWQRDAKPQKKEGDGEKAEKEKEEAKIDSAADKAINADQRLLYEPFELLTNTRRRLQIHLLQSLAAEYRAAFNELFEACQGKKKEAIETIREKIVMIKRILGELQLMEEIEEPQSHPAEVADAVLEVADSEISVEKWISEEEKKAMAEAAAREEERLRQLRENDAGQRALMQMMGGTLKTKKDLSALEIVLEKEAWMDQIPYDDMTEVQRQAVKEFEEKEKALAEEQDKYRKQLEADVKKARLDVQEAMQQFEVTLKELHHQRFAHDAKVFCQDLYCVRLQLALLQSVEDSFVLKQLIKDGLEANTKLEGHNDTLEAFKEQVAAMRERQDERLRHEKEVASAQHFRQQFANSGLESDAISALLSIFRRKRGGAADPASAAKKRTSQVGRDSVSTSPGMEHRKSASALDVEATEEAIPVDPYDRVSVGDPYADLGVPVDPAKEEQHVEEDIGDERPETVDEQNFNRMLELRAERYQAEVDVQKGHAVKLEMEGLLSHFKKERDDCQAEYDRLQSELTEHRQLMDRELYDIEILFKLKQGQVEVPQAAVVTDYSDAVVIDKEVVESRNRRILELGKEKVGTLDTTKEFRKKLNLIHWEHKMLALQTSDLEERTKDVHMLRVTKGLQTLLKGGEEGRNKADADLLERKIEHLNTTTQQKEQSLKKQYAMSNHATKLRKMENGMLEKKLRELQQNVIQREHIRRLRAPQGGASGGGGQKEGQKPRVIGGGGRIEENEGAIRLAQTSFREVKTRQSLMDAAKRHTEEIDLLRKELDRLRQKTFPSFVQLHEDRPANPDHMGR
mmetsp:Transcript_129464/g.224872  ORF Transcript_129464/g.224872 Transcript_129464/m.224872 type:complete len:1745 (+) Transcript_129464:81-5315(+)